MRSSELLRAVKKFDARDLIQLRRHVELVEALHNRSFLRAEMTWKLSARDPRSRPPTPSEEALDAALPFLRQLETDDERGSFHMVQHVLGWCARDNAEGDHLRRLLGRAREEHKAIRKRGRFGYLLDDDGLVRPGRVLDAWLGGHLMHGNDRGRFDNVIDAWTEAHHWVLADVAAELALFYRQFVVGPYVISRHPELHV
jgi:hypothetical protein